MERSFLLKRGEIDLETGRFPLTLFTNGEASDGHIVDIAGLEVSDNTPMFINHNPDPVQRMGRLENPRKPGKKTQLGGARMTFDGVIDVEGDGAMPDIRRDIAHGIHVGDITAMSGRWDPISATPRSSLRKDHYAYSDIEGGWETPMFFESARVLEGSIVGVPADAAAMIGRSRDLQKPEHVRRFWDVLVNGDPLSRDRALEALYVDAAQIEGWEEIACEDGKVFVPAAVARVWGLSSDELEDLEREEISLTGGEEMDEIKSQLSRLKIVAEGMKDLQEAAREAGCEDALDVIVGDALRDAKALRAQQERSDTTQSTEAEPVSAPTSEATETDEPVSEPPAPATERAAVARPQLPEFGGLADEIREELTAWLHAELGFTK